MAINTMVRNRTTENQRDLDLLDRAQAGDVSAGVELWLKYKQEFLPWVRVWNRIDQWEELFVDAGASQLYEALPTFKQGGSSFRTWAFGVAHNAVLKLVRDLDIGHINIPLDNYLEDELPAPTGPEDVFIKKRVREEAYRLEGLKGAAVRGRFFEDKSDGEIAEEQHIPRRKVCYRCMQGMAEIGRRLRDVPFTSIRPETRFSGYNYTMTDMKRTSLALPGGKEGDYA